MESSIGVNQEFWKNRRVFVTGATGLVGAWLVKELVARQAYVVALVRDPDPQSEFYRTGLVRQTTVVQGALEEYLTLERAVNEHEIEVVFHLAAQPLVGVAHRAPLTFESNIRGTYHLLEVCRQFNVKRVVIASSDKAYGEHDELPYTEHMGLNGRYPYEVSKSCADMIAQSYYHTYQLPVAIARCGNIYGGGDINWSRIVPDTIRSSLLNVPVVLRSDGSYQRDYIYVRDVVSAYMRLAESLDKANVQGEGFNFGPGQALSVIDLVETILTLMGCSHLRPIIRNDAKGEIHSQYLDFSKAHEVLNWVPQFDLQPALHETIAWYKSYLNL